MKSSAAGMVALLVAALFASVPLMASAHFAELRGTVIASLHVDPEDLPTPGKPAYIFFTFEDSAGVFSVPKCDCTLTVSDNGKVLLTQKLTELPPGASIYDTKTRFIFPDDHVFKISVGATSTDAKPAFKPLVFNWYFRVYNDPDAVFGDPGQGQAPDSQDSGPSDKQMIFIFFGIAALFGGMLGASAWILYRKGYIS